MKKDKEKKKSSKTDVSQEEIDKLQQEIEKLIKDIGADDSILKIEVAKKLKRRQILMIILDYVFIVGLIFGISGYINWAYFPSFLTTVIYAAILIGIDVLLNIIINVFFRKIVDSTFGLITIITLPIALIVSIFLTPGLEIINISSTIFFIILLLIVRGIIKVSLVTRKILFKIKR